MRLRQRLRAGALLAVPVLVVAVLGWQRRWVADDAFINVRVVHNLFDGHGPVFNAGERVEVGTSTLWLAVLAVGRILFPYASVELFAVFAGLVATIAGLVLASAGAIALWRAHGRDGIAVPVGTVVVAALPPFWDYATSGLESGLTILWLAASYWLLVRRPTTTVTAIVIGLGPLVRPDLALVAAALGAALLLQHQRSWRTWGRIAAIAAAAPLGYEVLRAGYYGALVPNTALAKGAGSSLLAEGLEYLDDFAGRYLLVVPLALGLGCFALPLLTRVQRGADRAVVVAPIVGGLAHGLYVVRVGGDYMHGRLLLPATLAVVLPVAAVVGRPRQLAPALGVALWAVAVGTTVRVPYVDANDEGISDQRAWHVSVAKTPHPIHPEDYETLGLSWSARGSQARAEATRGIRELVDVTGRWPVADGFDYVYRFGTIGMMGVVAGDDVYVADHLSLANPVGARLEVPFGPDSTVGHAQVVPLAWDRARFARPQPGDPPDVVAARNALGCGALRELLDAVTAPMTIGRFVGNLFDAPRLTRLSIPADPIAAEAELCG